MSNFVSYHENTFFSSLQLAYDNYTGFRRLQEIFKKPFEETIS